MSQPKAGSASGDDRSSDDKTKSHSVARAVIRESFIVWSYRLGLLVFTLGVWEVLTRVPWFVSNTIFDPFFISRPSSIAVRLGSWIADPKVLWPHVTSTLVATLAGLVIAVTTGFTAGLLLSQSTRWTRVFSPFITILNSLPRIVFIPLITMIFGLGIASKIVTAWFVVFFLIFFNTFKGSLSIEQHILNFCRTLGASAGQLLWSVRIPHALAWTFAALPNAVAFALIGVVVSEFVGSTVGMGYLITSALATLNATDMFAAITVLSLLGLALVSGFQVIERRMLRWSPEFRDQ